jgi:hypothetical protein
MAIELQMGSVLVSKCRGTPSWMSPAIDGNAIAAIGARMERASVSKYLRMDI